MKRHSPAESLRPHISRRMTPTNLARIWLSAYEDHRTGVVPIHTAMSLGRSESRSLKQEVRQNYAYLPLQRLPRSNRAS
jgi:hypothetical protein